MRIAMIIVRSLMGLLLLFASVTFLFKLIPMPPQAGQAKVYNEGLAVVNLMFFVKVIELLCGLAFVIGRFVPLAALVIFPIILNILLFHGIVDPADIGAGAFLFAGDLFLAWYYHKTYGPLFVAK